MFRLLLGMVLALSVAPLHAAVKGEEVTYKAGDTVLKGYLAYDDTVRGKRPGVLVVHDWWGHGDFVRDRTRALAALGYTALAVDMFGDGKQTDDPGEADKLSGNVAGNPPLMKARFDAAQAVLRKHKTVDPKRLAAIGYSSGGKVVLDMARQGADLAGVVSYWGLVGTQHPAQKGRVKAKVLVFNGKDDPMAPPEQIKQFQEEMTAAGVDYRLIDYPGLKHAFTRPDADARGKRHNLPLVYDAETDRKSWAEMQAFFTRIF
ncbi:MAG: dienelactone hydrolase family protein [Sulfuricaulis sp.]|nr:dienelactone hydrolase family protein [Sulfuricaulis sp.]